jgi:hypothetical protein
MEGTHTIWYKTFTAPPQPPKVGNSTPATLPKLELVPISTKAYHPVLNDLQ